MESNGVPALSVQRDGCLHSTKGRCWLAACAVIQNGFQFVREDMVLLLAFFFNRLNSSTTEGFQVTLCSRANELPQNPAVGHNPLPDLRTRCRC